MKGTTAASTGGLPWYDTSEVRMEVGHSDQGMGLHISLQEQLPNGLQDFWVPISSPAGQALGWLCFSYVTTTQQRALFAASQWRSASEPAPPAQDRLQLPLKPLPVGFAPCL